MEKLKLNYKKTFLVGLAFASIGIFWTTYDFILPLMLNRTFGLPDSIRGLIMGLDNLLALFLLPIFGALSDKTKTKFGKRTPYIFIGTIVAVILILFLPMVENIQLNKVEDVGSTVSNEQVWEYASKTEYAELISIKGYNMDASNLTAAQKETLKADFISIEKTVLNDNGTEITNSDYQSVVQPAVRNYIYREYTLKNPTTLIIFMAVLMLILITFATYRSPAVALMPDVTPEPLRSPANAVINLLGGIGGGLAMIGYTIFLSTFLKAYYASYTLIFVYVAVMMLILVAIFLATVRENKLNKECRDICLKHGIEEENLSDDKEKTKIRFKDMPKDKLRNFLLILFGIFMCTMSTNAITSSLSVYAVDNMGFNAGTAGIISMVGYVLSAAAFIPVGFMATRFGRKNTVLLGFVVTIAALIIGFFITVKVNYLFIIVYLVQNFGGVFIGVNTLPMVLETSDNLTIGKFTGLYYTATMSASSITPFLSGLVMDEFGRRSMFIYSAVCMVIAICLFIFVKSTSEKVKKLEK